MLYCSAVYSLSFCQIWSETTYDLREVSNLMQDPFEIPNTEGALYNRTANYEISGDRTLVGIVWHDDAEQAQVYFSIIKQSGPGTVDKVDEVSMLIDSGYYVKNADIMFRSGGLGRAGERYRALADLRSVSAVIVYQRRLNINDP